MIAMKYAYGGNTNDTFSIIRQARNNHDFLIYLIKCLNTALLHSVKRIELLWN
jgi:hypothetical protein